MHQSITADRDNEIASDKFIEKEFSKYYIKRELVELFNEFSNSLLIKIHNHYLGRKYHVTKEDVVVYYNWCYNTICDKYTKIGFDFSKNEKLAEWFFKHAFIHIFDNKEYSYEEDKSYDFWYINTIMDYNSRGSRIVGEIKVMIDLYQTFKISL